MVHIKKLLKKKKKEIPLSDGLSRKSVELGVGGPRTQVKNLSLINRVTLNKSCYLSEPRFPTSEVGAGVGGPAHLL